MICTRSSNVFDVYFICYTNFKLSDKIVDRIFDVVFSSLRHPEKSAARGVPSDSCDVAGLRAQSQHNHVQYTAVYFLMENV